jgi:hypothetical protein
VDVSGQPVSVHGPFGVESFEDQEGQCALENIVFLATHT